MGAVPIGDAVGVGERRAAGGLDLRDHRLGRAPARAFAADLAAQIVDHQLGALGRQQQRHLAADAAARARDQGHLAL